MPGWSRRLHFIRLCFFPTTRRVYAWLQGAVHCGAVSNRRKGNSQNDPAVGVVGKGNAGDMQNTKKRQSNRELCESGEMSSKNAMSSEKGKLVSS